MNFSNILNQIEKLDPEVYERTSQRRDVIKNWTRNISMAALPFALGGLFSKAYGRGTDALTDVLNFALTLEYLEAEFYNKGVANANSIGITSTDLAAINIIASHENAHVTFLKNVITAAGAQPVAKPRIDLSGGGSAAGTGPFATATTNDYGLFLALAQTFEDTGVRAYKGQAPNLMSNNDYLTAALNIHSVEARHASHIRQMRRTNGGALVSGTVKPWITGNQSGIASAAVQPNYNGEDLSVQATINIVNIGGQAVSLNAATEAFDEPLTKDQVLVLLQGSFLY